MRTKQIWTSFFSFLLLSVSLNSVAHAQTHPAQCPAQEDPTDVVPVQDLESKAKEAQEAFEGGGLTTQKAYLDKLRKLVILVATKQEAIPITQEQLNLDKVSLTVLNQQILESLENMVGAEEANKLTAAWKRGVTGEERDRILNEFSRSGKDFQNLMADLDFQNLMADLAAQKNISEQDLAKANALSFEFSTVPAGEFTMGSPSDESGRKSDEKSDEAQRKVKITEDYDIQKTEVTQLQYVIVMGSNPSRFVDKNASDYMEVGGIGLNANRPVEKVSWQNTKEYIRRLDEEDDHYSYRLPTEAEWEKAARAGTNTAYSFGNRSQDLGEYAVYWANSGAKTTTVASKKPNPLGLYDVHGNVWEWCQDGYCKDPKGYEDPTGDESSSHRVLRGGSWYDTSQHARSANRSSVSPDLRYSFVGFRLVRTAK